jgi:hypothetical protein
LFSGGVSDRPSVACCRTIGLLPWRSRAADELSSEERHLLDLTATPAATLLGLVSMSLRTTLFGTEPAAWVDMWQAGPTNARLEWQDGPELAAVVAHLAARTYDGNLEGVPGLRPLTHTQYAAQMTWLATPDPVTLHLTRLD